MVDVSMGHFYDIFISHNRIDKAWASALATRLGAHLYNGRSLRPWLDERFLDPGEPASNSELTTALDRSRTLGLVLSPEALASKWVDFELEIVVESKGCKPSPWSVEIKPGSITVVEGEATSFNASLHVDMDDWQEFIKRKLSWDNVMKEVYGDSSRFSTLFKAWNAALGER